MPIAAVPAYLQRSDFKAASPGLRFGLLLPIWTDRADQEAQVQERAHKRSPEGQEINSLLARAGMDAAIAHLTQRQRLPSQWEKNDFAARHAWSEIQPLTPGDLALQRALAERQAGLAAALGGTLHLRIDAQSIAPFTTGLGNEHPLENGFAFLNPYGLPYLPGSGVKGVIRQAARELASGDWADTGGWSTAPRHEIRIQQGKQEIILQLSDLDVLFGLQSKDGDKQHFRGVLSFWDLIPSLSGNALMVEIMTPHQTHYYQHGESPHESGQPNPISFLTVPPGSRFTFHVTCDPTRLPMLLAQDSQWQHLLRAAFEHAFTWLGFGAKTAVGYGAMARDAAAEARAEQARAEQQAAKQQAAEAQAREQARQAALAQLSPVERSIQEFLDTRADPNQAEISAVIAAVKQGHWSDEDKPAVADWLKQRMQASKGWREQSAKKNPNKDKEYQNTLLVKQWLG